MLSRGLIERPLVDASDRSSGEDFRARAPRFQGENLAHNLALVEALRASRRSRRERRAGRDRVGAQPRRGHRPADRCASPRQLAESLAALELRLDEQELRRIEAAVPEGAAAGERYPEPQMAHLDSES